MQTAPAGRMRHAPFPLPQLTLDSGRRDFLQSDQNISKPACRMSICPEEAIPASILVMGSDDHFTVHKADGARPAVSRKPSVRRLLRNGS